jgi:hypothetical protein
VREAMPASGWAQVPPGARRLWSDVLRDGAAVLRSGPFRAYLAVELVASGYLVARRGPEMLLLLALVFGGAAVAAFLAWAAGRLPGAHPGQDPVPAPRAELAAIFVAYAGLSGSFLGWWPGDDWTSGWGVFRLALVAWSLVFAVGWVSGTARGTLGPGSLGWIARGWFPFWPLALAIVVPKVPVAGLGIVGATWGGLASGLVQQVLLQVGLTARLEAVLGRGDAAAVLAAAGFGAAHIAMNLPQAGGDWWIAAANAAVLQTTIGLVFCAAFLRHRAPLGLGFCHALLMA